MTEKDRLKVQMSYLQSSSKDQTNQVKLDVMLENKILSKLNPQNIVSVEFIIYN